MRILGHFLYLRIHDNMFTVLGVLGSPNKESQCPLCILTFSAGDLSRYLRGCGVHRTDAIRYENTFLPDYKLPVDVDR